MNKECSQIVNSALWAAYGDALGFMTELASQRILRIRTGKKFLSTTQAWSRKIGGKFGVTLELPAGCYSDDTQLRLATSRSIGADGFFDVEAFSKIELPVWQSYALGAGIGSKYAASELSKKTTSWFNNFFSGKRQYVNCGGNGAAMRVQPHIWATAHKQNPKKYLLDVFRNSICTHGHPRGIVGAMLYSMCLSYTLMDDQIPSPRIWREALAFIADNLRLLHEDHEVGMYWIPAWERATSSSFESAILDTLDELEGYIEIYEQLCRTSSMSIYSSLANEIGGYKAESRGSGTVTVILALAAAHDLQQESPRKQLVEICNTLGTDTDTIGTMAGALIGGVSKNIFTEQVVDQEYITSEALRMYDISTGKQTDSFCYPDLFEWTPPKAQADYIVKQDDKMLLLGLGVLEDLKPVAEQGAFIWGWGTTSFGQKVLLKFRHEGKMTAIRNEVVHGYSDSLIKVAEAPPKSKKVQQLEIADYVAMVSESNFSSQKIGDIIKEMSYSDRPYEELISFTSIIAYRLRSENKEW